MISTKTANTQYDEDGYKSNKPKKHFLYVTTISTVYEYVPNIFMQVVKSFC